MSKVPFIGALMLLLTLQQGIQAQQTFLQNNNAEKMTESIKKMMFDVGVPALSLAIIKNNKIVYSNAYGFKQTPDKDPVDTATIFQAGSLTKSFLVLIVYQLVDKGLLDLDKPMYQYLEYPKLEHDARYKKITPRMILSHSSGIENWTSDNHPDTLEIMSNPGEKFVYSGEGYVYLSKVVDLILKRPYQEYVVDLVIKPFQLKRSFTNYTDEGSFPRNYALGHNNFGKDFKKNKPVVADPAGSMEMTAQDYARLVIAIFNKKNLSENRIRDILRPAIKIDPKNPDYFFGPGFELLFSKSDTIISHGGSTVGYKAAMFYSTVTKNGFVFLTNSDRGSVLTKRINELTTGFNLENFFKSDYALEQYPSYAVDWMKIFKEKDTAAMFAAIEEAKKTGDRERVVKALNELGYLFMDEDMNVAKRLLINNVNFFPESTIALFLLGNVYMATDEYKLAYDNFLKAKELHFDLAPVEDLLKKCKDKLDEKQAKN